MKKTMGFLIGLVAVLVIGGSVYAGNQIARSNAIGETAAQNFALVDAGLSPDEVTFIKTEFDREDGRFVYEIKFYADGVTYEYVIDSQNGWILAKEQEGERTNAAKQQSALTPSPVATPVPTTAPKHVRAAGISLERAKALALADAGVTADQVTFSKAKLEADDGIQYYDLEFYIDGQYEYDYEIKADDGIIIERSLEPWEADDYVQPADQSQQQAATPAPQKQQVETPAPQKQQSQQAVTPAPKKQQSQQQAATPAPKKQQSQQQAATPAPQKQQTPAKPKPAPKKVYYDDDDDDDDWDDKYDDRDDDRDDDDDDDD